jgi:hypothetical protein
MTGSLTTVIMNNQIFYLQQGVWLVFLCFTQRLVLPLYIISANICFKDYSIRSIHLATRNMMSYTFSHSNPRFNTLSIKQQQTSDG